MTVPLNKAIDCCDSEYVDGEIAGLAVSNEDILVAVPLSYNTAKNLRLFHLLFCRDLAVVFDTFQIFMS